MSLPSTRRVSLPSSVWYRVDGSDELLSPSSTAEARAGAAGPALGPPGAARMSSSVKCVAVSRAGAYVCMGQIRLFLPRFGPFSHRFFAVFSRCPASWRQDGENAPKTAENGRKVAEIVVPKHPKSYVYPTPAHRRGISGWSRPGSRGRPGSASISCRGRAARRRCCP